MLLTVWADFLQSLSAEQKQIPTLYSLLKQLIPVELKEDEIILGCENQGMIFYLEKKRQHLGQSIEIIR
jgi:hypothetical protein